MVRCAFGKVTAKGTCVGFTYGGDAGPFGMKLMGSKGNKVGSGVYVNGVYMHVVNIATDLQKTPDGTLFATVVMETPNDLGKRHTSKRSPEVQRCITRGRAIRRELQLACEEYVKSVK